MAHFTVLFTVTEITRRYIVVEAETPEEAQQMIEDYEFDNSESTQVDSIRWEVSDVEV